MPTFTPVGKNQFVPDRVTVIMIITGKYFAEETTVLCVNNVVKQEPFLQTIDALSGREFSSADPLVVLFVRVVDQAIKLECES